MLAVIRVAAAIGTATATLAACGGSDPTDPGPGDQKIPISDMTPAQSYLGYAGGLYPGGNTIPAAHLAAGIARARAIQPLDVNGNPESVGQVRPRVDRHVQHNPGVLLRLVGRAVRDVVLHGTGSSRCRR